MSVDPSSAPDTAGSRLSTALRRGAAFFLLWMLLMQSVLPGDLAVGVLACLGATGASLRLLPPAAGGLRFGRLLSLLPHFLWKSMLAGIDVARRVLQPHMPLSPGFVAFPSTFPPGFARNTFATITSLLPGSVAAGEAKGVLFFHCIDDALPVLEQLSESERLLARALVAERHGG